MISTMKSEHVGIGIETRRPLVSWGAIFAGWLLGNALMLLLMNFGSAIGLAAVDMTDPMAVSKGIAISTVVWVLFTSVVSFFVSGIVAAWLAGNVDRVVGAVHGMCVWALAVAFTVFMGLAGIAGVVKTSQSIGRGLAAMGAGAASQAQSGQNDSVIDGLSMNLTADIKDQIGRTLSANTPQGTVSPADARQALDRIQPATIAAVSAHLLRGDTDQARNTLATQTDLSRQQIDDVMAGLSQKAEQARARFTEAAKQAANYSAGALWLIFFSGLFALIAAALGGSSGAHRLVRSYRRFERFEAI